MFCAILPTQWREKIVKIGQTEPEGVTRRRTIVRREATFVRKAKHKIKRDSQSESLHITYILFACKTFGIHAPKTSPCFACSARFLPTLTCFCFVHAPHSFSQNNAFRFYTQRRNNQILPDKVPPRLLFLRATQSVRWEDRD